MRRINFTSKKAEMSLTVVVSAVIALVVLIVLIYIFTNSSQKTSKTFASCGLNGGTCDADCVFDVEKTVDGKKVTEKVTTYQIDGATCSGTDAALKCCARADWV